MKQRTLERRLDLLKLEGNGLLRPEIVEELSKNYACSRDAVWYDFRTRQSWQPKIEELKKALLKTINRHDQLYRKASLGYLQADSTKAKLIALNLMRAINREAFEMMQSTGDIPKVKEQTVVSGELKIKISPKLVVDEHVSTT